MHQHDKLVVLILINFSLRDQPIFYNIHMCIHSFGLEFCGTWACACMLGWVKQNWVVE